jgi:hypothetical protein
MWLSQDMEYFDELVAVIGVQISKGQILKMLS